ncbi:MAG: hypothetical protein JXQ90_04085 [Cyclobacteriaceae bacterium]
METQELLTPERADIDMICDGCLHEITEGEDFYYDNRKEEVFCDNCSKTHLQEESSDY